jgi:hypothetical protein
MDALPPPTPAANYAAAAAGHLQNIRVGAALTPQNRTCMSLLYSKPEVGGTRLHGLRVEFFLVDETPRRWRTVYNPFSDDLDIMQQRVADPQELVNLMMNNPNILLAD